MAIGATVLAIVLVALAIARATSPASPPPSPVQRSKPREPAAKAAHAAKLEDGLSVLAAARSEAARALGLSAALYPGAPDHMLLREARERAARVHQLAAEQVSIPMLHRLRATGLPPRDWFEVERRRSVALGAITLWTTRAGSAELAEDFFQRVEDGESPDVILAEIESGRWG